MTIPRLLSGSAMSLGLCLSAHAAKEPVDAAKPTSHNDRVIEGWTIHIDDRLLSPVHKKLRADSQESGGQVV